MERLLLDTDGMVEHEFAAKTSHELKPLLGQIRKRLREAGWPVPFVEVQSRYRWAKGMLDDVVEHPPTRQRSVTDRIDRFITHHVAGLAVFAAIMFLIFQAIYPLGRPIDGLVRDRSRRSRGADCRFHEPGAISESAG